MGFKMKGWNKPTDPVKKVKNTISKKKAKNINIQNISAVQEKGGKKFVHTLTDKEYYDPTKKNSIGGFEGSKVKRDTVKVSKNYPKGHLIDETQWETGKATKKKTKLPKHQVDKYDQGDSNKKKIKKYNKKVAKPLNSTQKRNLNSKLKDLDPKSSGYKEIKSILKLKKNK